MDSDLLVFSYCVRPSVGLVTLAKCMHSNENCSFVDTSQSMCHGKNVPKRFVNTIHLVKVQCTEYWKKFEQQIQWWTRIKCKFALDEASLTLSRNVNSQNNRF